MDAIDRKFEKESLFETVGSLARLVSSETVQQIGESLIVLHRPIAINYAAMFSDRNPEMLAPASPPSAAVTAERVVAPAQQSPRCRQMPPRFRASPAAARPACRSPMASTATTSSVLAAEIPPYDHIAPWRDTSRDCARTARASFSNVPSAAPVRSTSRTTIDGPFGFVRLGRNRHAAVALPPAP